MNINFEQKLKNKNCEQKIFVSKICKQKFQTKVANRRTEQHTRRWPQETQRRPKCRNLIGGICKEHGEEAIEKWKSTKMTVVGEAGVMTVKRGKKEFYVCDLGINKKKMRQKLSFRKTTPLDKDKDNTLKTDTTSKEGRFCDSTSQCVKYSSQWGNHKIVRARII